MTFLTTPFARSFVGFDSLFDELEKVSHFKENSYPPYNIENTGESSYEISIALAGFKEEDLNIEVKENILTISANNENTYQNRNYVHKGIAARSFIKKFRLAEHVEVKNATFENGMLIIMLFKNIPESELSKKININAATKKHGSKAA